MIKRFSAILTLKKTNMHNFLPKNTNKFKFENLRHPKQNEDIFSLIETLRRLLFCILGYSPCCFGSVAILSETLFPQKDDDPIGPVDLHNLSQY